MRKLTYREALTEALREEMKRDDNVFLLGENIGTIESVFGVTEKLVKEFGRDRIRDTPISEAAIVGAAVGAAITGMRPVAEIMFVDFMCYAMGQVVNQVAKTRYMFGEQTKVPITIRTTIGTGANLGPQHSQSLEAWFIHTPGLKNVMPSTPYDAKGLLKTAIRDDNPVIFYEHKMLYESVGEVPEHEYTIPFGKADIKREGEDVTIIATSRMVQVALSSAKQLEKKGIKAEVIDPRTLVPLDKHTIIESVKKTKKVIVVTEDCKTCGVSSELSSFIIEEAFDYLDAPIKRVSGLDVPIPFSPVLEKLCAPDVERVIQAVNDVI